MSDTAGAPGRPTSRLRKRRASVDVGASVSPGTTATPEPPSPAEFRKRRSSLSALDDVAGALRRAVLDYVRPEAARRRQSLDYDSDTAAAAPRPAPRVQHGASASTSSLPTITTTGAAKNNRKSGASSRPPPAWMNRAYTSSSSPALQRFFTTRDEADLRSAQPQRTSRLASPPDSRPLLPSEETAPSMVTAGPMMPAVPITFNQILDGSRDSYPLNAMELHMKGMAPSALATTAAASTTTITTRQTGNGRLGYTVPPKVRTQQQNPRSSLSTPLVENASVLDALPTSRPPLSVSAVNLDRMSTQGRARRSSTNSNASTSTATTASGSIISSHHSNQSRARTASWSSQTSFESNGSAPPRPQWAQYQLQNQWTPGGQYPWQRPAPIKTYRRKAKPGELFAALPGEVLGLILGALRNLHLQHGSTSCATCWMRDCCSLALSARKWLKFARVALYEDIQLVGPDGQNMKKKYKLAHSARMTLLRRTLRASPQIAGMVHTLKVPLVPSGVQMEEYHDAVAALVMACPNLERMAGFHPGYNHSFQRLFYALSTRERLKEMDWILEPSPFQRQHRMRPSGGQGIIAPGDIQPEQSYQFLYHHDNWRSLTSLTMHCLPGATLSPDKLFTDCVDSLPSLQNLHLSHLPYTAFNDSNLICLPRLKKLTLSHMSGVTTAGISTFATRPASTSIESLTLIHINLESLPALARIFANLIELNTFNLVQSYPPTMPADEVIWLFPYLASSTLRNLHWDVPYLPTRASPADVILTKSIAAGGFPALRAVRVPHDPEGVFQALCRPRDRIDLSTDRYRGAPSQNRPGSDALAQSHGRSSSGSAVPTVSSRGRSKSGSTSSLPQPPFGTGSTATKSPTSPSFPSSDALLPREHTDLLCARLDAQARLESARRFPRYFVNVIDEDGTLVDKFGIGAFIGDAESKIRYILTPDVGATDEGGGLVGMNELLGDGGEDLFANSGGSGPGSKLMKEKDKDKERDNKAREGCTGRWNTYSGAVIDKKDKDRWWHTERGRWRGVELS